MTKEMHLSFGSIVAGVGDVDGDGTPDILVADPGVFESRAVVWAVSGKDGHVLHTVFGDAPRDGLGIDVRAAGDVDKDGHADWIVGAGSRYSPEHKFGFAVVYSGKTGKPIHRLECRKSGDGFGSTVSGAGDVNKDGYADLIVGAYDADGKPDAMGVAYVFSGLDGSLIHVLGSHGSIHERGIDVSGVGDVNVDGFADVAVSVVDESSPAHAAPELRVYPGKDASLLFSVPSPSQREVRMVRGAGDADGDGRPDILVSAIGGVALVSGRDGKVLQRWSGSAEEEFGWAVAGIGDVDGDHFGDVIVSSRSAKLWSGRIDTFSGRDGKRIDHVDATEDVHRLGCSIDSLGDIDGDGCSDYVVGTDHHGTGEDGRVEVHSGRTGALLFLFHRRGDGIVATRAGEAR